jgi:peptidoglycan hydrolase CwlO-like protein
VRKLPSIDNYVSQITSPKNGDDEMSPVKSGKETCADTIAKIEALNA